MMTYTILALLVVFSVWGIMMANYFQNPIGGGNSRGLTLDYQLSAEVSNALKGTCAMVIVCHHWCLYNSRNIDGLYFTDRILPLFGGNFALVVFLFLSGYGITKSENKTPNDIKSYIVKRIWKIYKHAIVVYSITAFVYMFALSSPVDANLVKEYHLNPLIEDWSHRNLSFHLIFSWFVSKLDWYVFATIVLYAIFYIGYHCVRPGSSNIVFKRLLCLSALLVAYYAIAHEVYGVPLAHYYRNLWAFLLGVMLGMNPDLLRKVWFWILCGLILAFNHAQEGLYYDVSSIMALIVLLFFGLTNRKYNIRSRFFGYLGGISYYLYLCHRMFYYVLWSYDYLYFLAFIILSIAFATAYTMMVRKTFHIA